MPSRDPASRVTIALTVLCVCGVALSVGLMFLWGGGPRRLTAAGATSASPAGARQAARLRPEPSLTGTATAGTGAAGTGSAGGTEVATVLRTGPRYTSPGQAGSGTVPATWYGRPSVLPVIATTPGWVRVRLAQRPDGSTTWLPDTDVALGATPYRIVVSTASTRLSLYDDGKLVFTAPAGVGAVNDPTPPGHYFIAFQEQPPQPNPGYGPFILVTSAHSRAISDWSGSGDAIIGIHGPLGMDSAIGTAGARISHGCVRLHDRDLERLAQVLPGSPVDVVG